METGLLQTGNITGPALRQLREQARIPQKELAVRAGLPQVKLCKIELGLRPLTPEVEKTLLTALTGIKQDRLNFLLGVTQEANG